MYRFESKSTPSRIVREKKKVFFKAASKQLRIKKGENKKKQTFIPTKTFNLVTLNEKRDETFVKTFPIMRSRAIVNPRGDKPPVLENISSSVGKASYRRWLRLFNGDFLSARLICRPSVSFYHPSNATLSNVSVVVTGF